MTSTLPYLTSPGALPKVLDGIKNAATPPNVNADFVQAKLGIKGGSGRSIPPYLKKIGMVGSDGVPTKIYERFRNSNVSISGAAIADAIRYGYKPLYSVHEYVHELNDADLKGLIVQVTGEEDNSWTVKRTLSTFKNLKSLAKFEQSSDDLNNDDSSSSHQISSSHQEYNDQSKELDFNISYTINLNLPSTTNIEVFNAIFKNLKENLLRNG